MSGSVSRYSLAKSKEVRLRHARPFCDCKISYKALITCGCGEEYDVSEWKWQLPSQSNSWVVLSENQRQVMFHPYYSSGTALVRGDTAMIHNYHYYWEVKMLTDTYGTDIMIGMCSDKARYDDSQFRFTSLLGQDSESYGLSYTGAARHEATVIKDAIGFCKGSIVGVRLDMWNGTMEFYLNRKSQGVSFYNLRRHRALYPMMCSTAAQSCMKLTYAASWKASLQIDALKILNSSLSGELISNLPPGLWQSFKSQFWLTLPSKECKRDDCERGSALGAFNRSRTNMLSEVLPSQYVNGFYIDNVERNYRLVLWEGHQA